MPGQPAADEAPAAEQALEPQETTTSPPVNGATPHEPATDARGESPDSHPDPLSPVSTIASGEKAKARDILAAIRTLKTVEQEKHPATPEEKHILARFAGFGPVALSLFPDPVTGGYTDSGWWTLG